MPRERLVDVACKISRSGFSGERVFRVAKADGSVHVGAAPVHYFETQDRISLAEDVPPKGDAIDGWIRAILIQKGSDMVGVVFPGGEMALVKADMVRPLSPEVVPHVPV